MSGFLVAFGMGYLESIARPCRRKTSASLPVWTFSRKRSRVIPCYRVNSVGAVSIPAAA